MYKLASAASARLLKQVTSTSQDICPPASPCLAQPYKRVATALLRGVSLAFVLALPAEARAIEAQQVSQSDQTADAARPVETLYAGLRKLESKPGLSSADRVSLMTPVIDAAFNLPVVLKNSVGMRYAGLKPSEQSDLLEAFRRFTVARYVSSFGKGEKVEFKILPRHDAASYGGGEIVHTTISSSDSNTELDYVVQNSTSGYQITDILLNGHISQVAAQRADFSSGLTSGGVDGLEKLLDRKTQTFLGK